MSDIVERLRKGIEWTGPTQDDTGQTENLMDEAADEITRLRAEVEDLGNRLHHVHRLWANNEHALRAENERLRTALRLIADDVGAGTWQGNHARAALEEKP